MYRLQKMLIMFFTTIILSNTLYAIDKSTLKVCFYEHANYQRQEKCFERGEYSFTGIKENDTFSSLKVPEGLHVQTFEHSNFKGEKVDFLQDTLFLDNFNDIISSLKVISLDIIVEQEANIQDYLQTQQDLNRINNLDFIVDLYQQVKVAKLHIKDGYWIRNLNLPQKTSKIPINSTLKVLTEATWDVNFENEFVFSQS